MATTELSKPLIDSIENSSRHGSIESRTSSLSMHPRNHASLAKYNRIKSESLSWTNISVQVNAPDGNKKYILNNISGYVKKGNVLCILGPVKCPNLTQKHMDYIYKNRVVVERRLY